MMKGMWSFLSGDFITHGPVSHGLHETNEWFAWGKCNTPGWVVGGGPVADATCKFNVVCHCQAGRVLLLGHSLDILLTQNGPRQCQQLEWGIPALLCCC